MTIELLFFPNIGVSVLTDLINLLHGLLSRVNADRLTSDTIHEIHGKYFFSILLFILPLISS